MKNWEGMLTFWAFCSRIGVQEFDILNVHLHTLVARRRYCPVLPQVKCLNTIENLTQKKKICFFTKRNFRCLCFCHQVPPEVHALIISIMELYISSLIRNKQINKNSCRYQENKVSVPIIEWDKVLLEYFLVFEMSVFLSQDI